MAKSNDGKDVLIGTDITYQQWLMYMKKPPKNVLFEDYCFPNEVIKSAYIKDIHSFSENDVKLTLTKFLMLDGITGADKLMLESLMTTIKNNPATAKKPVYSSFYHKRLMLYLKSKGAIKLYDSILWLLELLPDNPREALGVISAYLSVHMAHLPDGRIYGLSDAEDIIRVRYFDAKVDNSVLYSLDPTDFEHVVEYLYHEMGYETKMTKKTYDGGRDIIADKSVPGKKEHLVISCKRVKSTVSATDYREIMAVVEDEKATKGVVIATSDFSSDARKYEKKNPRIELINQESLHKLLNEYIGANWYVNPSSMIRDSKDRHPDESRIS